MPTSATAQDRPTLREPNRRRAARTQFILGYLNLVVSIVQGVLMVPMYLHYVGAHLYGLWLAAGGIGFWLSALDLGISGLMGQRMAAAYGQRDYDAVCKYYFNGMFVQVGLMVLIALLAVPMAWYAPMALHATGDELQILRWTTFLSCLSVGSTFANYGQTNAAFALQRPLGPCIVVLGVNIGGAVATVIMLRLHFGLYAIAGGSLMGAVAGLIANSICVGRLVRTIGSAFVLDRVVLTDMIKVSPALIVSRLAHALAGRIEPTVISLYLRPELAVAYSVTRRSADIIQMGLDRIIGAITAGFTHLVSEGDRVKAKHVLDRVITGTFALAAVTLAVYVASNGTFVGLWVGKANFAGQNVTVLIAISIIALFLNNTYSYLLGAAGEIASSSLLMSVEAIARVGIMAVLLPLLGLAGLPIAIAVSAGGFAMLFAARLYRRIQTTERTKRSLPFGRAALMLAILTAAAAVGRWFPAATWGGFVAVAVTAMLAATLMVAGLDGPTRSLAFGTFRSLRRSSA